MKEKILEILNSNLNYEATAILEENLNNLANELNELFNESIAGMVWELNPEEGDAWIKKYVEPNRINEYESNDDIIVRYKYCPVCGSEIVENKNYETLVSNFSA